MSSINESSKRLLIYTHYNPQGLLSSYVLFTLKKMNPFYQRVIFVSNSPIRSKHREELSEVTDKIIQRENKGFDFAAWRDAIFMEGWNKIEEYDYLTLMNDTCFGPMYDLSPFFKKMENKEVDYWGITEHTDLKTGFWRFGHNIIAHLQSYFISYGKQVLKSAAFQSFWENVEECEDVEDVIDKYEIGLSQVLGAEDFSFAAYLPADNFPERIQNQVTFFQPHLLIEKKSPFIKVKSIFFFKHPEYLRKKIEEHTNYSYSFIEEHITQTFLPNKSLTVLNKNYVLPDGKSDEGKSSLKIAIHLHAYFVDGVEKFLSRFKEIQSDIDIYITTDTKEKKKYVDKFIEEFNLHHSRVEIILTENRGRDILPWLRISNRLDAYDIVGHFHVKRSATVEKWVAQAWMDDLCDSLLSNADWIFNQFEKDELVGIVIPDMPYYFKVLEDFFPQQNGNDHLLQLWSKLNVRKTLDEEYLNKAIMSYGTMFWYRPAALRPLMDVEKFDKQFLPEPLPHTNAFPHSFEGIVVYVAWSQNFDFRVVLNKEAVFSGFDVHNKTGINDLTESFFKTSAWKIGRSITWVPWKIKRFFRGKIDTPNDFP